MEGMPDTLVILGPVILCRKNAGACQAAENAQIIDKEQLIDNGHPGHLLCAHPADHDIVQKRDKIGDGILHHHRDSNGKDFPVKRSVPDQCLPQCMQSFP